MLETNAGERCHKNATFTTKDITDVLKETLCKKKRGKHFQMLLDTERASRTAKAEG